MLWRFVRGILNSYHSTPTPITCRRSITGDVFIKGSERLGLPERRVIQPQGGHEKQPIRRIAHTHTPGLPQRHGSPRDAEEAAAACKGEPDALA
jgi:hypothetical protein